jgi:hypothetical protein
MDSVTELPAKSTALELSRTVPPETVELAVAVQSGAPGAVGLPESVIVPVKLALVLLVICTNPVSVLVQTRRAVVPQSLPAFSVATGQISVTEQ